VEPVIILRKKNPDIVLNKRWSILFIFILFLLFSLVPFLAGVIMVYGVLMKNDYYVFFSFLILIYAFVIILWGRRVYK
jgi:hypothetical protein